MGSNAAGAAARAAAVAAQPGSLVLSTAEAAAALQAGSAAVSFSRSPTLPLWAGTVPLQCSPYH